MVLPNVSFRLVHYNLQPMETLDSIIENQYHSPRLYEDILKRLEEQGVSLEHVSRENISGVDEFHVRGAEVSRELAKKIRLDHSRVLDVGCGLGGPSRMLADEFQCQVTGIDLSHEYIRTATALSGLVGLSESTTYIQGNALNLPFGNRSFDVVWTQHVQMNIRHKLKFYSEIERVLNKSGTFIYYDIFKSNEGKVHFPLPWADDPSASFLSTTTEIDDMLEQLCFKHLMVTDETLKAKLFLQELFEDLKLNGPPQLGLNVLMGSSTKEKLGNILKGIEEEQIVLQSGIYIKRPIN